MNINYIQVDILVLNVLSLRLLTSAEGSLRSTGFSKINYVKETKSIANRINFILIL